MSIGIVGAGITGLSAAYDLTRWGHAVTLYEARSYAGGLSAGFRDARWDWALERFYHHWFASDDAIIRLIDELGARDRLFFRRPTTSLYHGGELYPLDSPVPWLASIPFPPLHRAIRVLQFSPLTFPQRLRAGLVGAYLTLIRDWRPLERVTAHEWMRRTVGERAYAVLWRPLLISKFGEKHYRDVNMAWMWARLYKRTAELGYFEGGFQAFVDLLIDHITRQGGSIRLGTPVLGIRAKRGRATNAGQGGIQLDLESAAVKHDAVIATVSPQALLELTPELTGSYASTLRELKSMGAIALILALKHGLSDGHYWINLPKGAEIPFMGLVEHTNYIDSQHYGGDHLVYCGDYLPADHPSFHRSKAEMMEICLPGLRKINPDFREDWVRDAWMFTERYAQPIPGINHSHRIPEFQTPISDLWMANMSQVYPWDRGSNYAVETGREVARQVAEGV